MIKRIIDISLQNRKYVSFIYLAIIFLGIYSIRKIPIDAIPDLSEVQVIVYTPYPGQSLR